jgi:exopolyphosphatase / guanosine-5'-triphosphate,3'-diphosphate pyrophosphatase
MNLRVPHADSSGASPESVRIIAVIEVGSTGIRLVVARVGADGRFSILDRAERGSRIGREVFSSGSVSRESLRQTVSVFLAYRELLTGYGLAVRDVRVFATSAIREASNRDTFVDRIELQTGFRIEIIEDIEENHLMYLAVQDALRRERRLLSRSNAMILEVGGGTTEVMLLVRGKMAAARSIKVGTLRGGGPLHVPGGSPGQMRTYLEDAVRTACDGLEDDLELASVRTCIIVGADARFTAGSVGERRNDFFCTVGRKEFLDFARDTGALTPEECVAKFRLPWTEAEGLVAGLSIEREFLARTGADFVIVPDVSIREGILLSITGGGGAGIEREMHRQTMASARALGRRYRYDADHADRVAALALRVFDDLAGYHGMNRHDRLLLETACLVHDIGSYIKSSGHHRHGEYLVANSELFGIGSRELRIVAGIVRYHRKSPPSPGHPNFVSLPREDRMRVMKLTAIIRIADALDRGHDGRVGTVTTELVEDRFIIHPGNHADFALERLALATKGDMFADVFGLEPVLA